MSCNKENVEKSVECCELVFDLIVVTFHTGTIESHIPIRKVFQKVEHRLHDVVKLVCIHFVSHETDQILVGCDDPCVSVVRLALVFLEFVLEFRVINEIFA